MIKYDIGKAGKNVLSIYVPVNPDYTEFTKNLRKKFGGAILDYYNCQSGGILVGQEWWVKNGRRRLPQFLRILKRHKIK